MKRYKVLMSMWGDYNWVNNKRDAFKLAYCYSYIEQTRVEVYLVCSNGFDESHELIRVYERGKLIKEV